MHSCSSINPVIRTTCTGLKDVGNMSSVRCSTVYPEKFSGRGPFWGSTNGDDDMCVIDDQDDLFVGASTKLNSVCMPDDCNKVTNCSHLHHKLDVLNF